MDNERDTIVVENEFGEEIEYAVEVLFDMEGNSYALLNNSSETIIMRVEEDEDGQFLVGINDEDEKNNILSAYEIAVDAASNEDFEEI